MKTAAFVFFTGLILTFGAVGGIENDAPLLDSVIVAAVGLAIMFVGTKLLKRANRD